MASSSQKPATMDNATEAALFTLLSSENQAQNTFFVFGNVYVNNQNDGSSDRESTKDSTPGMPMESTPEMPKESRPGMSRASWISQDSASENESLKNVNDAKNLLKEMQNFRQQIVKELKTTILMEIKERLIKYRKDRGSVFKFGENNVDGGFNFKSNSKVQSNEQN